MCGRFTIVARKEKVSELVRDARVAEWRAPRYNVAPGQDVPVILNDGLREVSWIRWGLVPSWAKDPSIGSRMINARAETLSEKPAFRKPFARQRCLVLADGFYEWHAPPGSRQRVPVYFQLATEGLFAFAGLWDTWHDPESGPVRTCAIVTTAPNELVAPVHDRMPAILSPGAIEPWLSPSAVPAAGLQACLAPLPAALIKRRLVSRLVNNPRNDDPRCLEAVEEQQDLDAL
jgi:putative SOS response-associated peptidase YedK